MKQKRLTRREIAAVVRFFKRHGGKTFAEAVRDEIKQTQEIKNKCLERISKT